MNTDEFQDGGGDVAVAEIVDVERPSKKIVGNDSSEEFVWLRPGFRKKQMWLSVAVAFAVRMAVLPFLLGEQLSPERAHWRFGFEAGRLASSLALGKGFHSPLFAETGPSAWMTPVYPAILAGIFKLFGVYTTLSAVMALTFNAIVSALTCIPVALIAYECLGVEQAVWAGWLWAFFPYAVYYPMDRLWETWLATLLLALSFWLVVRREAKFGWKFWIGYGALWSLNGLTSPTLCAVMPFFVGYALYRVYRKKQSVILPAGIFLLVFVAGLVPWTARNYEKFHHLIPLRDGFGLSLRLGTPGAHVHHWAQYDLGPWHNDAEWSEFQRLGEYGYMQREQRLADAAIEQNPKYFVVTSLRRAVFLWTGFWSFNRDYLREEPLDLANIPVCTAFTVLALLGLVCGFRRKQLWAILFASALLFFPLVFYLTSPEDYYRRPLDALMLVLVVNAFRSKKQVRAKSQGTHKAELVLAEALTVSGR
jgi:Dolichyl-phosphate-mannose-protein mannosyltransferase